MRKAYIDLELESEINSDIHTVKIIYILDKDDEIPNTITDVDSKNGITIIKVPGTFRYQIDKDRILNPNDDTVFYNYHFLGIEEDISIFKYPGIRLEDKYGVTRTLFNRNLCEVKLILHKDIFVIPDDINYYINDNNEFVIILNGRFEVTGDIYNNPKIYNRGKIDKLISRLSVINENH